MFDQTFKSIDDILWKEAGCSSALDYVEQSSWLLFLKYLDGFLCEAFDYLQVGKHLTTQGVKTLQERTFYGKEKKSLLQQAFAGKL
ncbi:MAG: hypothetical protein PHO14_03825 [Kiritimatiellae bacterium]|nr:hypothetical protein [Kiritimatiellia bacterium]MDD4341346.1 hypothetical protein [Kiritimatiellia bacterium]